MKSDYVHIGIVLDASGSMHHLESDTKGTFNRFLEEQRKQEGKTAFDLFQFSDEVSHLVRDVDLSSFQKDLMADYHCGGCTALNDAICEAIDKLGSRFAEMSEEERPAKVVIAIITDGLENASKRFTVQDVKERIERQRNVYRWEFLYLAADLEALEAGGKFGISEEDKCYFNASEEGLLDLECSMVKRMYSVRSEMRKEDKSK